MPPATTGHLLPMKTKDRILQTSLALFNDEGEPNVSTVDIASELDMSPGNLYYHFKGKEPIIQSLYSAYEVEMRDVLSAPIRKPLRIDDNWIFLYIIFEEIYDFRFFYYNLAELLSRYETLAPKFTKLLAAMKKTMRAIYEHLRREDVIAISDAELALLAERSTMLFTLWPTWSRLSEPGVSVPEAIHNGVYTIFSQTTPYLTAGRNEFQDLLSSFHSHMMSKT